jgi:ribosomal protein S18 acetylase RimI-like enzyme
MSDNKIGRMEWISTLPEYRKKGIGAAVCCAGIEQLINDGACIITLTARAMGVSLYKSLGFEVYY